MAVSQPGPLGRTQSETADPEDSGHFLTLAAYERYMVYPIHAPFHEVLQRRVQELGIMSEHLPVASAKPQQVKSRPALPTDNKPCKMMRPEGYYVMLKPKIAYPRVSLLTHAQQGQFLKLRQAVARQVMLGAQPESLGKDASDLEELRLLVVAEQKDFLEYLRSCFDQLKQDYKYVDCSAQRYVFGVLHEREGRVLRTKSNQFYTPIASHDTGTGAEEKEGSEDGGPSHNVQLVCEKAVLNVGQIPRIVIPIINNDPEHRTRATGQGHEMQQRFPNKTSNDPAHKPVVSMDPNCAALATKHYCDVVISGSVLTALMSTVDGKFLQDHSIPVVVREYEVLEGDKVIPHKVVYLNKPYKPHHLSPQGKNRLYHKTGLKFALYRKSTDPYSATRTVPTFTHFRNESYKKEKRSKETIKMKMEGGDGRGTPETVAEDLFGSEDQNVVEEFGTEGKSLEGTRKRALPVFGSEGSAAKAGGSFGGASPPKKAKTSLMDMVKGDNFGTTSPPKKASLMDMVSTDAPMMETEGRRKSPKRPGRGQRGARRGPAPPDLAPETSKYAARNTALDNILESQSKMLTTEPQKPKEYTVRSELENPAQYVHWHAPKTSSYSVWNLGQLRLLVRTNHHGNVRDVATNKTKPLYLEPKMEYQPTLGGEILTTEECCHAWINSYIRHRCHVLRARIHTYTSEILMLEGLDHHLLLPPGCPYDPQLAMSALHHILHNLASLPSDQYVLRCHPDSTEYTIYTRAPKNAPDVWDLRAHLQTVSRTLAETPPRWLPLDTELQMPYHKIFSRIAATFTPADGVKQAQMQRSTGPGKNKNKKKKKGNVKNTSPRGQNQNPNFKRS